MVLSTQTIPQGIVDEMFKHVELKMNKNFKVRWMIIFGASDFTPPISQDFAVKQPESFKEGMSKISAKI